MSHDCSASFPDWPRNLNVFWGNKALSEFRGSPCGWRENVVVKGNTCAFHRWEEDGSKVPQRYEC